jgi:hypothetical protein
VGKQQKNGRNALGINGRNGSVNVKETDGKSNFVLDQGARKTSLKANT